MNDMRSESGSEATQPSAFQFYGNWQEFMPIAITNLLLTIVTLGFYRFWGTTRERQYLWSKSQFIDERLEWTGTGKELFIGFLVVAIFIGLPFFAISLLANMAIFRNQLGLLVAMQFGVILLIFYLSGVARFRALRYRLGRTYWRGIRGGSDDPGFSYGWSYIWRTVLGYLALGLMIPWSMMKLWNERWNKMSFGPHRFVSKGDWRDTFARFLLYYLSPILFFIAIFFIGIISAGVGYATSSPAVAMGIGFISILVFYGILGLIALAYYAKYFRVAVDGLSLHNLEFSFKAQTKDWLILFLGHAGLWLIAAVPVIVIAITFISMSGMEVLVETSGVGEQLAPVALLTIFAATIIPLMLVGPFIRYRNWRFFMTYMEAYGEVNLDDLTQSETDRSKHGEGLLDAFDVGAI